MSTLALFAERLASPIGELLILTDDGGRLRVVDFDSHQERMERLLDRYYGHGGWTLGEAAEPSAAARALRAYFEGDISAIDDIETETGGTDFQRKVWAALRDVPADAPTSYGTLAARIGQPTAVRAVGLANGANPIAIVVPCHRVVGSNGSLTGYGGGIERKRWLLAHEAEHVTASGRLL